MPGRGEGSSRAMLATARPSSYFYRVFHYVHDSTELLSYTKHVGGSEKNQLLLNAVIRSDGV